MVEGEGKYLCSSSSFSSIVGWDRCPGRDYTKLMPQRLHKIYKFREGRGATPTDKLGGLASQNARNVLNLLRMHFEMGPRACLLCKDR